jgi:uncharacterized membrane protein (UPF0127 family)
MSLRRLSCALLLLAFSASSRPLAAAPAVVPLTLPSGKVLQAELMISDEDRQLGLMFRPSLPADRGLLFVFGQLGFHGIWMKNCRFPIDIVWLDEQRRVVHLAEAVPPCKSDPCPSYEPLRKAAYVIELNAGQARREKLTIGASVGFVLPR